MFGLERSPIAMFSATYAFISAESVSFQLQWRDLGGKSAVVSNVCVANLFTSVSMRSKTESGKKLKVIDG